ncbi:hypothetical protein ZONE111905_16970 [Zobellia nedashkovskayae]
MKFSYAKLFLLNLNNITINKIILIITFFFINQNIYYLYLIQIKIVFLIYHLKAKFFL